jgi:phosphate transport system substrate-binding protein
MKSIKKTAMGATGLLIMGLGLAMAGCGSGDNAAPATTTGSTTTASVSLTGIGSTFVNPAMAKWTDEYKKTNPSVEINYQALGSGAGISQYEAGTVDFGATDAPVPDKELEGKAATLQIPVVSGPVVLIYNLPGVTSLKLSADTLAGIFMGTITKWDDAKIAADNAGVKLPSTTIAVSHRSDGSGTSYIFTNYLSAVNADWKAKYGVGKTVNWPVGTGGKGNDGVSGLVKATEGGIGYVELAYAIKGNLAFADVKNAAGEFMKASPESTQAAVSSQIEALKKDVRTPIVNSSAKGAYPICGFTYVLVAKEPKDAAKSKALIDFLNWTMDTGQTEIADLQYAPLPKELIDMNKTALSGVTSK